MIPYIHTPYGDISTFVLCIAIGTLGLLLCLHLSLKTAFNRENEEIYIFPKIVVGGMIGLGCATLADAFFKYIEYGIFRIAGITFYGGLIGAIIALNIQLTFSKQSTQFSKKEWFDRITPATIVFHIWGRIGCFCAGCCYGKTTNSFIGVVFPNNIQHNIIHDGKACYPTQLFEVIALCIILGIVLLSEKKFRIYLLLYAVCRFFIEFYRGDDRGSTTTALSPAQGISVIIILCLIMYTVFFKTSRNKDDHRNISPNP